MDNKKQYLAEQKRFIMVDLETAGPNPSNYALLSIGACMLKKPRATFYIELQPDKEAQEPEAMLIHGLNMQELKQNAVAPKKALLNFEEWIKEQVPDGEKPIFVGFNAAFDWMFLNDYFFRYLGRNPFGYAPLDIKSLYMGVKHVPWALTAMKYIKNKPLRHNALADALDQAEILADLWKELTDVS